MYASIPVVLSRQLLLGAMLVVVSALPSLAEQRVVLTTGYSLQATTTERVGNQIRLYGADGALTELPFSLVAAIEDIPDAPEAPAVEPVAAKPTIDDFVAKQSVTNSLHPDLLYSVIAAESNFDPQAISRVGAIGLMQLMPATAAELEVDPYDPAENVQGGAAYLRFLLNKYAGADDQLVRAIAAYNAGPAAVDRYDGVPPYRETQEYVRRVLKRFVALADSKSD